ncbi:hypothetical protein Pth03_05950 [Planotetraspora thailandica]|uniref:Uncharacterized protein n=1 Tax=Planotetraspora thailandica TaxID=487172 RepID=A0A8J3XU21_9ACTN|nr:hypothetical protein Pth03_05950 [Planotetraspora thailandica]
MPAAAVGKGAEHRLLVAPGEPVLYGHDGPAWSTACRVRPTYRVWPPCRVRPPCTLMAADPLRSTLSCGPLMPYRVAKHIAVVGVRAGPQSGVIESRPGVPPLGPSGAGPRT